MPWTSASVQDQRGVAGGHRTWNFRRRDSSYTGCTGLKIPQIGWNNLEVNPKARLFKGLPENPYVYFVHSYYLKAKNPDDVAASTFYSTQIHASVERGNVFACQFHPEKSSEVGLKILKNFIDLEV